MSRRRDRSKGSEISPLVISLHWRVVRERHFSAQAFFRQRANCLMLREQIPMARVLRGGTRESIAGSPSASIPPPSWADVCDPQEITSCGPFFSGVCGIRLPGCEARAGAGNISTSTGGSCKWPTQRSSPFSRRTGCSRLLLSSSSRPTYPVPRPTRRCATRPAAISKGSGDG